MRFTQIIRGKKAGQQFDYRRVGKFNPYSQEKGHTLLFFQ